MPATAKHKTTECNAGTSTRDAVETAIESSKGDKISPWEEFVDVESSRISRWRNAAPEKLPQAPQKEE